MQNPLTYIIVGATGDLATRKIIPALCNLFLKGELPNGSQVIAFSRKAWTTQEYRTFIAPSISSFAPDVQESFLDQVIHVQGVLDEESSYHALKTTIATNTIFCHLAIQADLYVPIIKGLRFAGIEAQLLIEKPFGYDRVSALELENTIEHYVSPDAIYRIDHYLGKAGLWAVYDKRIRDKSFEESLTTNTITNITCRLVESLTVLDRGAFYDTVGALRDVGQNHLLEMLAAIIGEPVGTPVTRTQALASLVVDTTVLGIRAQYKDYRNEKNIPTGSQTETYFRVVVKSTIPRLQGVPIVLEAGKALAEKKSDITIAFADGHEYVFDMEYPTGESAYEKIIQQALKKDQTYFVSREEMNALWAITDSIRSHLEKEPLQFYETGTSFIA